MGFEHSSSKLEDSINDLYTSSTAAYREWLHDAGDGYDFIGDQWYFVHIGSEAMFFIAGAKVAQSEGITNHISYRQAKVVADNVVVTYPSPDEKDREDQFLARNSDLSPEAKDMFDLLAVPDPKLFRIALHSLAVHLPIAEWKHRYRLHATEFASTRIIYNTVASNLRDNPDRTRQIILQKLLAGYVHSGFEQPPSKPSAPGLREVGKLSLQDLSYRELAASLRTLVQELVREDYRPLEPEDYSAAVTTALGY